MSTWETSPKPPRDFSGRFPLLERVDFFRLDASRRLDPSARAAKGQFLTPPPWRDSWRRYSRRRPAQSVCLMWGRASAHSRPPSSTKCAAGNPPEEILVTAYEIDPLLVEYLKETFKLCREACERQGIRFAGEVAPTVKGLRLVWELRGISCLPLEIFEKPRKGLYCSCSFGRLVTALEELSEAVAMHCVRGGEKLRRQRLAASHLTVFISTSRFRQDPEEIYSAAASWRLPYPTSYTPALIAAAQSAFTSQGLSTTRRASS